MKHHSAMNEASKPLLSPKRPKRRRKKGLQNIFKSNRERERERSSTVVSFLHSLEREKERSEQPLPKLS
jgi:hypothetical protein